MSNGASHFESFTERSKLIDTALKYTDGDIERAKLMVSGQFNDARIIKGKFEIVKKRIFGIFYIFINTSKTYIMNINAFILSDDNNISKVSIFDGWKTFYADFDELIRKRGEDALPSVDFVKHMSNSINNFNLYTIVENHNLDSLTETMIEIINKFYTTTGTHCQVDVDVSNSLTIDMSGVPLEIAGQLPDDDIQNIDGAASKKISEIESKFDYVINGRVIISPIKGKFIRDIKIGEKIKVILTGNDNVTRKVAKTFNAITQDEEILPVNVRVTEKFPMEKSGYYIYGLVAKNVLVRIIEEENVKIETDSVQKSVASPAQKSIGDKKLILYLVLAFGILLLIIVILAFI